jgi:hypothetical protein
MANKQEIREPNNEQVFKFQQSSRLSSFHTLLGRNNVIPLYILLLW